LIGIDWFHFFAWKVIGAVLPLFQAKLCFLKNSIRESIAATVNFFDCIMSSIKEPECNGVGEVVWSDDAITEVGDDEVNGGDGTIGDE
jgi:hypothetical protein